MQKKSILFFPIVILLPLVGVFIWFLQGSVENHTESGNNIVCDVSFDFNTIVAYDDYVFNPAIISMSISDVEILDSGLRFHSVIQNHSSYTFTQMIPFHLPFHFHDGSQWNAIPHEGPTHDGIRFVTINPYETLSSTIFQRGNLQTDFACGWYRVGYVTWSYDIEGYTLLMAEFFISCASPSGERHVFWN